MNGAVNSQVIFVVLSLFAWVAQAQDRESSESSPPEKIPEQVLGSWHFTEENTLKPSRDELTIQADGSFTLRTGRPQHMVFYSGTCKLGENGSVKLQVTQKRTSFFDQTFRYKVDMVYRLRIGIDISGNLMVQDLTTYPKPVIESRKRNDGGILGPIERLGSAAVDIDWKHAYASQPYENEATRSFEKLLNSALGKPKADPVTAHDKKLAIDIIRYRTAFGTSILENDGRPNWGYLVTTSNLVRRVIDDEPTRSELTQAWIQLAKRQESILKNLRGSGTVFDKAKKELVKNNIKIELANRLRQLLLPSELNRLAVAARIEFLKSHWLSELISRQENSKLIGFNAAQIEMLKKLEVRCDQEFVELLNKMNHAKDDERTLKRSLDLQFYEILDSQQRYVIQELIGDYLELPFHIKNLTDDDSDTRISAAHFLASTDYRSAESDLENQLKVEKDPEVVLALHYSLACQGKRSSVEHLISSMKHSHQAVSYITNATGQKFGYNAVNYRNWLSDFDDEQYLNWTINRKVAADAYHEFTSIYRQSLNGFVEFRNETPRIVRRKPTPAETRLLTRSKTARAWQLFNYAIESKLYEKSDRVATAKLLERVIAEYPDTYYVQPAKELLSQLRVMIKEDAKFQMPEEFDALPVKKKIEFHIYKLRDLDNFSFTGSSNPEDENYNPAAALVGIGKDVIPTLETLHNDRRLIRNRISAADILSSYRVYPDLRVSRYSDAARDIIERIQWDGKGPIIIH